MAAVLFPSCIYTIRHSEYLRHDLNVGGSSTFEEARRWAKGESLLLEAKARGQALPVLFANAEDTSSGVTYWAIIDALELTESSTRIHLSDLVRIRPAIPLDNLRKLSDGEPLSANHIHPYVPCHTPLRLESIQSFRNLPDKLPTKHVEKALVLLEAGERHAFGRSTTYDVIWKGKRYPPKAVVGIAAKLAMGREFFPDDFSGGIGSKCFRLLELAGFEVVVKPDVPTYPDEVANDEAFFEGAVSTVRVNRYERSPEARKKCIAHYGARCVVCGLDFGKRYGCIGEGFIHVHHLKPLATIKKGYKVDAITDLRPVCPNCHSMLHRKSPPFLIEELHQILTSAS